MELEFTIHALEKIKERKVSLKEIMLCLTNPDKVDRQEEKIRCMKLNRTERKVFILVCVIDEKKCKIITVIKSSQLNRYLK